MPLLLSASSAAPHKQETTLLVLPLAAQQQLTLLETRLWLRAGAAAPPGALPPPLPPLPPFTLAFALPGDATLCVASDVSPAAAAASVRLCLASAARCFPSRRAAESGEPKKLESGIATMNIATMRAR